MLLVKSTYFRIGVKGLVRVALLRTLERDSLWRVQNVSWRSGYRREGHGKLYMLRVTGNSEDERGTTQAVAIAFSQRLWQIYIRGLGFCDVVDVDTADGIDDQSGKRVWNDVGTANDVTDVSFES